MQQKALFNPAAIALWSLPFSPLFGAWLHIQNWTALGEPAKAVTARRWFRALLLVMLANGIVGALAERLGAASNPADFVSVAVFLLWYGGAARPHARAVRRRTQALYERRRWDAALLTAVLAGTAYHAYTRLMSALIVNLT